MRPFPYVQSFVDRKSGLVFHYFRKRGCKRTRLPGLPGSREFMAAYQDARDQPQYVEIGAAKRSKPGSVSAAMAAYYTSLDFTTLAAGTQSMRRAILERFRADHGDKPIAQMPTKFIVLTLNKMKPFAAKSWLKSIRHLMQFAIKVEMIKTDPTQGIKLKTPKSDGIHTWRSRYRRL
jgi:hypothetical protein